MVILDTACLIELCKPKPMLSEAVLKKIEREAHVLSISFAEIALKIKRGRLILDLSAEELHSHYQSIPAISIIDIGCREWFDSINLEWQNRDPVDRLIVAYAQRTGGSIITTDLAIKEFYKNVIW